MDRHEWDTPARAATESPARIEPSWVGPGAPPKKPEPKRENEPDRAWDKLLLVVGAIVVVVALLVVPGILNRGGNNPVAEAARATMSASGVRTTFTATMQGPFQMTMQGSGVLNGETKRAAIDMRASLTGAVTRDFRVQEIVDDHDIYLRAPGAGFGLTGSWIHSSGAGFDDLGGGDSSGGLLGGTSSSSPKELLESLGSASDDVSTVGREMLDGREVTHYTADIDVQKLIDEAKDRGGDVAADLITRLDPTEAVDVWIDQRGLLRRMTANLRFGQLITVSADMDFSNYGIRPDIKLPPPSQVQDMTGLQLGS